MPAKFINSLSDENRDLQKQIGCMNGIFQLFDRRHFLSGGRRVISQNHRSTPSGKNGNHSKEPKNASQKTAKKNHKAIKENQRVSTESSRPSFSSSCSSSLLSFECNRASQLEPCSFNQNTIPESQAQDSPIYQPNASFRSSQQSPDLRDVVKDSIYREARGLSVKTATKGESRGQTLKYFDSPRPLQHPKSANPKVSGPKESFQVLHRLQEIPRKSREGKHVSSTSALKDAPRFSCDGRESRNSFKSTMKLKELPRLSLDSRAGSMRSSTTEMKSNDLLGNLQRGDGNLNNFSNQDKEPESRTRLSNVVAKLMGLELENLPGSMSTNGNKAREIKSHPDVENNYFLGSSRSTDENKQSKIPGSPTNLHQEPISLQQRTVNSVKKPFTNSKFPIEPSPWKQPDGITGSQTPALKSRTTVTKAPDTSLSVYGEIEKRLAQLEFKRSGKDLRALKQILEAMHKTKEILETRNEAAKLGTQTSSNSSLLQNSKLSNLRNTNSPISALTREINSPKSSKSPIVIMKPAKHIQNDSPISSTKPTESSSVLHGLQNADSADGRKESIDKQKSKDLIPRANKLRDQSSLSSRAMDKNTAARLTRQSQTSKEPQSTTRDNANLGKSSGTSNLRETQKKLGLEKQARLTTPTSDSIRSRRHSDRQPTESGSPCRKPRPKSPNLLPSDDESSDISSDARDLSNQGDAISLQSESTISLASQVDEEVSSTDRSNKINNFIQQAHQRRKKPVARSMKDGSIAGPAVASSERPSPVSVLDATFYGDDLPSPIKKKSIAFKGNEVEWNPEGENHSSSSAISSLNMINHKKVENIHLLTQNLTKLWSAHEEPFVDEITPPYNSTNPDHKYISEILLASGLLENSESGFTTIHLHQAGHPINPNLFLALEQAKASTKYPNDKESGTKNVQSEYHIRIQRKLVFDVVNEILIHKLFLESSNKNQLLTNTLADKRPRGILLLGELCSEVDRLQGNASNCSLDDEYDSLRSILQADLMHQSTHWTACTNEIPALVLDVERLIFKDLITEVMTGEALGLRVQFGGHCRQLFSK